MRISPLRFSAALSPAADCFSLASGHVFPLGQDRGFDALAYPLAEFRDGRKRAALQRQLTGMFSEMGSQRSRAQPLGGTPLSGSAS